MPNHYRNIIVFILMLPVLMILLLFDIIKLPIVVFIIVPIALFMCILDLIAHGDPTSAFSHIFADVWGIAIIGLSVYTMMMEDLCS